MNHFHRSANDLRFSQFLDCVRKESIDNVKHNLSYEMADAAKEEERQMERSGKSKREARKTTMCVCVCQKDFPEGSRKGAGYGPKITIGS